VTRVLVVDNRDSFVHTLVDYLHELGAQITMIEADEIADAASAIDGFDAVMISPGPGVPGGASVDVVRQAASRSTPLLGVCLGHQAIAVAFGGVVDHAPELMHGMVSDVRHDGSTLFTDVSSPFGAGRYHSLAIVDGTLPDQLIVTARTDAGTIMAIEHVSLPIFGVQFHPESVLSDAGHLLLANWLAAAGDADAITRARSLDPSHG